MVSFFLVAGSHVGGGTSTVYVDQSQSERTDTMTKRSFDLALLVVLLSKPAFGLVKMASRRWVADSSGPLSTVGNAVQVAL